MFVSVVLPCLNERPTVAGCVGEALRGMADDQVDGEVVVADNGSADGSPDAAASAGARVVHCDVPGYGAALQCGIQAARGDVIVMADADGTYDLRHLRPFVEGLDIRLAIDSASSPTTGSQTPPEAPRQLYDMVMGNRFAGGIEPGAMPWTHRYVGVPALTWMLNCLFGTRVGDAHCGLRSFTRLAYQQIQPKGLGMEFASELILGAALAGLRIGQVPTVLRRGPSGRVPHLRSLPDGCRHVRMMLAARFRGPVPKAADTRPDNSPGPRHAPLRYSTRSIRRGK